MKGWFGLGGWGAKFWGGFASAHCLFDCGFLLPGVDNDAVRY